MVGSEENETGAEGLHGMFVHPGHSAAIGQAD